LAVEPEEEATEEKVGLFWAKFLKFCACESQVAILGLKCIVGRRHLELYTSHDFSKSLYEAFITFFLCVH
jgi:hypothetical protein